MNDSFEGAGAPFYKLAALFTQILGGGDRRLDSLLMERYPRISTQRAVIAVCNEFSVCIERVSLSRMKPGRASDVIEKLLHWQDRFVFCSRFVTCSDFCSGFPADAATSLLNSYGDTIDAAVMAVDQALDREAFLADTRHLLDNLAELELPEYAARVLHIKMSSLVRIIETCSEYSDDEIRRRIKSIFADFCAEFAEHDKKHQKAWEKMTGWAKSAMLPAGLLCLGLVADASAVAGLLTSGPTLALPPPG